jgi:excisionase family DNA binding protein
MLRLFHLNDILQLGCFALPGAKTMIMAETTQKAPATSPADSAKTLKKTEVAGQGKKVEILINGVRMDVDPEMEAAVLRAYKGSFETPKEMTTTQAAEFLDVSRPFVVKLVQRGVLPCRMVGKHRRIPTRALEEYREKMFREARAAADEMTRLAQEAGPYDEFQGPPRKAR